MNIAVVINLCWVLICCALIAAGQTGFIGGAILSSILAYMLWN